MIAQGAANRTRDIDGLSDHGAENIERIVEALEESHPKLRTPRDPVPIVWDTEFFRNILNVTLSTELGSIDLLAEVPGVEGFDQLWNQAQEMNLFGVPVRLRLTT